MFRKAHLLFTLLCAGTTSAIMILMSFLYLHVSENSLYENQFHSFQNDIGTIAAGLEESSSLSMQWLTRMESQNHYNIYVIDNGVSFLYNTIRSHIDSNSQELFSESLDAYHAMFEVSPSAEYAVLSESTAATGSAYTGIWHTE